MRKDKLISFYSNFHYYYNFLFLIFSTFYFPTGILHVVVGLLSLTLGVSLTIIVGIKYWLFSTGIGIWVGLLITVTGCINIKTGTTATNRCTVIICAFINIITLFLSLLSAFRFVTALR